jgi:hypothetical protein
LIKLAAVPGCCENFFGASTAVDQQLLTHFAIEPLQRGRTKESVSIRGGGVGCVARCVD